MCIVGVCLGCRCTCLTKLYAAVKERELSPSELLQDAVRAELRRHALLEETNRYLAELVEEVGQPSDEAISKAEALSRRIRTNAPTATTG